jgi:hypothetical protein
MRRPRFELGCCASGKKGEKVSPYRFVRELAGLIVYEYRYDNKITMNVKMLIGLYDKVMLLLYVYFLTLFMCVEFLKFRTFKYTRIKK